MTENNRTNRIAPVDGLRAFAVLGVMWAHVWMFYNNVSFSIGPVDLHRVISFGGVGVDLFFVISGFCMYLMHAKKNTHFTIKEYGQFLFKRWRRIAPAFYFFVTAECLLYLFRNNAFPAYDFFAHLLFVNTFLSTNILSPPYWSLSTEWQFYLVLPFIFIGDPSGKKLWPRLLFLAAVCLCFRLWLFYSHNDDILHRITITGDKIWFRFIEFGWGIIAARLYMSGWKMPEFWTGARGFIAAFIIAYAGRLSMVTEVAAKFGHAAFIVRTISEPLMTAGFAVILFNVIESKSLFSRLLSLSLFQFLGKISYSMYLCHWIISQALSHWLINKNGISPLFMNVAYLLSVLAVIPVAWLSYTLLEAPYFKKKSVAPAVS